PGRDVDSLQVAPASVSTRAILVVIAIRTRAWHTRETLGTRIINLVDVGLCGDVHRLRMHHRDAGAGDRSAGRWRSHPLPRRPRVEGTLVDVSPDLVHMLMQGRNVLIQMSHALRDRAVSRAGSRRDVGPNVVSEHVDLVEEGLLEVQLRARGAIQGNR